MPAIRAQHTRQGWLRTRILWPLVPVYAAALAVKNAAYARKWFRGEQLDAPVISVGNLSMGGAGKTPLVIRLAELLSARGLAVDVLSRGYGRHSVVTEQVDPGDAEPGSAAAAGDSPTTVPDEQAALRYDRSGAYRFGDEPLLIAQAARVPVYVGERRFAAGQLAEQSPVAGERVHLLDDGFQHRELARAVDIVILHRSDFSEQLLPAGRLREPLSALRRASIVVLREEDSALEHKVRRRTRAPIWWMTREITLCPGAAGRQAVAFCGIARGEEFFTSLTAAGATLTATHAFDDHHVYASADIEALVASVQSSNANLLLTTEKDLVRLSATQQEHLRTVATLEAVPLHARLRDEDAAIDQLLALAGL